MDSGPDRRCYRCNRLHDTDGRAEAFLHQQAAREVIAETPEQCDVMWGRAVAWVLNNSHWKIQTQTDNMIQTFAPVQAKTESAFVINKVPLGGGRCQLSFRAACGNFLGCDNPAYVWKAHFARYVYGEIQ